jgi:hypothetical protein
LTEQRGKIWDVLEIDCYDAVPEKICSSFLQEEAPPKNGKLHATADAENGPKNQPTGNMIGGIHVVQIFRGLTDSMALTAMAILRSPDLIWMCP